MINIKQRLLKRVDARTGLGTEWAYDLCINENHGWWTICTYKKRPNEKQMERDLLIAKQTLKMFKYSSIEIIDRSLIHDWLTLNTCEF